MALVTTNKAYPVGAATYSKHPDRYPAGAPRYATWADGAWVNDARSNRLVDLTSGMGAVILGHQHPAVHYAITKQLGLGHAYPLPSRLEERVAERLLSLLTWERAESVRFGKNGADVTTSAVRLARAVTGREQVIYCDYHGHHDWCMTEPPWNAGIPVYDVNHEERPLTARVKREDLLGVLAGKNRWLTVSDIAAVVLEGSSSVNVGTPDQDFLRRVRGRCDTSGIIMVLDEMVTGFRMAPGGAAEALGIEPDLACYGKAMANGMPLSAIVGPWEYMKRYEEDVFFSLTHGGEALSLAAADATMRVIVEEDVTRRIGDMGAEIIDLFGQAGRRDILRFGYPQRLVFDGLNDTLLEHHVLSGGYANLTLAHVEDAEARETIMKAFWVALS